MLLLLLLLLFLSEALDDVWTHVYVYMTGCMSVWSCCARYVSNPKVECVCDCRLSGVHSGCGRVGKRVVVVVFSCKRVGVGVVWIEEGSTLLFVP
jgi:hypothetical protein